MAARVENLEKFIIKVFGVKVLKKLKYFFSFIYYKDFKQYKKKKKIIHIQIPDHGNMGDQAIVYATNKYLKEKFNEYEIIEIYKKDIYKYAKAIKMILNHDDFIVLIGGGNMGNLWVGEEIERRFVIKTYSKNKIISMPQTIDFTNDEEGKKELYLSKKIYNSHKNLTVIAREEISYKYMKDVFFNANVLINPDMVLFLNTMFKGNEFDRSYIMTCFRDDKESVLKDKGKKLLLKLKNEYNNVLIEDTVIKKKVFKENREEELLNILNKFLKAKVVITDRLHGMIFAAITKTPCIVTSSLDHKVKGTYNWIKDLNYIRFVDEMEFDVVKKIIDEFTDLEEVNEIDYNKKYFNTLASKF